MSGGVVVVALANVLVGVAVPLSTWLAATGRMRRNDFAGIRTRATMETDAAWVAAHRAVLPLTYLVGVVGAGGAVLVVVVGGRGSIGDSMAPAALPLVAVAVLLGLTVVRADRAARETSAGA